jgi:hypothetical protein
LSVSALPILAARSAIFEFHRLKTIEGSNLLRRNERDQGLTVTGRVGPSPLFSLKWLRSGGGRSSADLASRPGVPSTAPLAGYGSFSALRSDGSLWVWSHGQLTYARSFATEVIAIGYGTDSASGPIFLTSDGAYHNGNRTVQAPCPSP